MGNVFAGSEIVELGIQIEKNGKDFYNILVNQSMVQVELKTMLQTKIFGHIVLCL